MIYIPLDAIRARVTYQLTGILSVLIALLGVWKVWELGGAFFTALFVVLYVFLLAINHVSQSTYEIKSDE